MSAFVLALAAGALVGLALGALGAGWRWGRSGRAAAS